MSSTPNSENRNTLNEDQFEDDGLPGIDKNFPPDQSFAVDDPALVSGGSETQDDLKTRMSRERDDFPGAEGERPVVDPMISDQGDPATSPGDDVKGAVAQAGIGDPDGPVSPEQAAMHIVEPE